MKRLQLVISGLFAMSGMISLCLMVSVNLVKMFGYEPLGPLTSFFVFFLGVGIIFCLVDARLRNLSWAQSKFFIIPCSIFGIFMLVYSTFNIFRLFGLNEIFMIMSNNQFIMGFIICTIISVLWYIASWPEKFNKIHWLKGWTIK